LQRARDRLRITGLGSDRLESTDAAVYADLALLNVFGQQ
jgi:hypothetical protein